MGYIKHSRQCLTIFQNNSQIVKNTPLPAVHVVSTLFYMKGTVPFWNYPLFCWFSSRALNSIKCGSSLIVKKSRWIKKLFFLVSALPEKKSATSHDIKIVKTFANIFRHFKFSQQKLFCHLNHLTYAGIFIYNWNLIYFWGST